MENKRRRLSSVLDNVVLSNNDQIGKKTKRRLSVKRASLLAPIRKNPSTPTKTKKRNSAPFLSPFKQVEDDKETLSDAQLSRLYTETIRLAAAGKITQKNTWSINLIDYIDDLLSNEKKAAEEKVTKSSSLFRKASNTLDASIKIYSSRVDSVHSQMFKVLGGLSSRFEEDQEQKDGKSQQQETTPKNKRNSKVVTLLTTDKAKAAALSEKDLSYEVDPMFFKMASAFDEGGAKGLLLNNLQIGENLQIVFDSDLKLEKIKLENASAAEKGEKVLATSEFDLILDDVARTSRDQQLCPLLPIFEEEINLVKKQISDLKNGDRTLSAQIRLEIDRALSGESVFVSESDVPGQDRKSVFDQNFDRNDKQDFEDFEDFEDISEKQKTGNVEAVKEKTKNDLFLTDELYDENFENSEDFMNWAGPNFWSFRRNLRKKQISEKAENAEKAEKSRNEKMAKTEKLIDFGELLEIKVDIDERSPKKCLKRKRVFNTLPEDMHLKRDLFLRPFYRPHLIAKVDYNEGKEKDEPLLQEDSSVRWYNYDNPNDRRYIAEIDQDDNFAPDDSEGDFEPNNSDPLSQSQFENLLSEQSSTFNQQNRSFFQVDVQQLKSNLWRSLKAIEETKAFDENNVNEKMANSEEDSNLSDKNLDKNKKLSDQNLDKNKKLSDQNLGGKKISFKESVSLMKKRNKSMESVSVQYCFVCLLHLANENGLELKTPSLEDDFTVELQ